MSKRKVCISITYHKTVEVDIPDGQPFYLEMQYKGRETVHDILKTLDDDGWCEDEIEVILDDYEDSGDR